MLILLEEMIRRNQLSTTAILSVLFSSANKQAFLTVLTEDPSVLRMIDMVTDRSMDFIRASLLHRSALSSSQGNMTEDDIEWFALDESADLSPVEFVPAVPAASLIPLEEKQILSDENETDEDEADRRKNRGRKRDESEMMDDGEEENESENNKKKSRGNNDDAENSMEYKVHLANEGMKKAVSSSRGNFSLFMCYVLSSLNHEQDDLRKEFLLSAVSAIWRSYFGFQNQISAQFKHQITIVSSLENEVKQLLQTTIPAEMLATWSSCLQ
jgi:hypothetical protein